MATRGSPLSLIQSRLVVKRLQEAEPGIEVEELIIKTHGDREPDRPLQAFSIKGIFEKEVDRAVLEGSAHFAVHSAKDVPTDLPPGLRIVAVPERADPRDALVSTTKGGLWGLKAGSVVGTSSLLRMAELKHLRPELEVKPIRGNVDTRVEKCTSGGYDAVIVAFAGLKRLGLKPKHTEVLSLDDFPPAPGQGSLAVVAREEDASTTRLLEKINQEELLRALEAERAAVRALGAGCRLPLAALAEPLGRRLRIILCTYNREATKKLVVAMKGRMEEAQQLGERAALKLLEVGGYEFSQEWKAIAW